MIDLVKAKVYILGIDYNYLLNNRVVYNFFFSIQACIFTPLLLDLSVNVSSEVFHIMFCMFSFMC